MYMLPSIFMFASSSKEALADPVVIKRLTKAFVDDGPDWLKRMPLSKGNTPPRASSRPERRSRDTQLGALHTQKIPGCPTSG